MGNGIELPPGASDWNQELSLIRFAIEFFYTLATDPSNIWQVTVVGQIIEQLIQLFSGKPRELDSITIALRLMHSQNRIGQIAGQEIIRLVRDYDIVLSDSSVQGQRMVGWIRSQLRANLLNQGVTLERANQIIDDIFVHTTGKDQQLPIELRTKLSNDYRLFGSPQLMFDYQYHYDQHLERLETKYLNQHGLTDPSQIPADQLAKFDQESKQFALREIFNHESINLLYYLQFSKVPPTRPPLINVQGNPDPHFPKIPHFIDPCQGEIAAATQALEKQIADLQNQIAQLQQQLKNLQNQGGQQGGDQCVALENQITQLQAQIRQYLEQITQLQDELNQCQNQPIGPQGDGGGDQLSDCCAAITAQLAIIAQNLQGLQQGQETDCCVNVIAAINAVASSIAAIVPALPGPTTVNVPPPDLTPIVLALGKLLAAIQGWPALWGAIGNSLAVQIGDVAAAIREQTLSSSGSDLSQVVEQLKKIFETIDVPIGVYQQLARDGWISSDTLQLVGAGEFGSGLILTIKDYVRNFIVWLLKYARVPFDPGAISFSHPENSIAKVIEAAVDLTLAATAVPLYPVIKGAIDGLTDQLAPTRAPTIADSGVDTDLLLTKTLAPALLINAVALVAGYFGWNTSEQLREYVDIASSFLGLEEIKEAKIGALFHAGPVRAAELNAKARYLIEPPDRGQLELWFARGLISESRFRNLLRFTQLAQEFNNIAVASSFEGLNPRMLLQLINTGLFTDQDLEDELTWSGIRQQSQHRLLLAAPYLATKSERDQLRTALESAFVAGLLAPSDLANQLDSIEHNTDLRALVTQRANLQQQISFAKELETGYSREFLSGFTDQPTFETKLEAIGLQPPKVQNLIAKYQAELNATLHRQATAAERQLARQTTAIERKAALKNFADGIIDAPQLAAALALTGLTVEQAAAWLDLAVLNRAGSPRWIYGLQATPENATILRERVTALTDQRKGNLISDAQFEAALKQLKIPSRWINALRAAADALLVPKSTRILLPVSTAQ